MLKVADRPRRLALFALGLIAQVAIVGVAVPVRAGDAAPPQAFFVNVTVGHRNITLVTSDSPFRAVDEIFSFFMGVEPSDPTDEERTSLRAELSAPAGAEYVAVTPPEGCTLGPTLIRCQCVGDCERRVDVRAPGPGSTVNFIDISHAGGQPILFDVPITIGANPPLPPTPFRMTIIARNATTGDYNGTVELQFQAPIPNLQGSALLTADPVGSATYGPATSTPGTVFPLSPTAFEFFLTQPPGTATEVNVGFNVITDANRTPMLHPNAFFSTAATPALHYNSVQVQVDSGGPIAVHVPTAVVSNEVTIVATDPTATEAGSATGAFTVSRTGSVAAPLTVFYGVGGTATPGSDYAALPGSVTIAAGMASASIIVTPLTDALVEANETVILTLAARQTYAVGTASSATVNITSTSNAVVTVVATDATATETGLTTGRFTVRRTGSLAAPLTVFFTVGGTAARGLDYIALPASVTIPAGAPTAFLLVRPNEDALMEGTETVVLTLSARPTYTLGPPSSATVNIVSNEVVTVMATDVVATEAGRTTGTFTVRRTGLATAPLTVFYALAGTAVRGTDYVITPGTVGRVIIPAGATSALVTVTPNDDPLMEGTETVVLTLTARPNYTVGAASSATVNVTSNEIVTVTATDPTATEAGNTTGTFTVRRTGLLTSLTVFYALAGTAVRGTDYVVTPAPVGRVMIPAGAVSASITVRPNNDVLRESTETVVLALIPQPTSYTVGPPSIATVTITSNE